MRPEHSGCCPHSSRRSSRPGPTDRPGRTGLGSSRRQESGRPGRSPRRDEADCKLVSCLRDRPRHADSGRVRREPLYRWNDPTREFSDGTLWFWKTSGRPVAVVATELYPQNPAFGTVWALEFTSLSTGPIKVDGGEHFDRNYADMYPPRADGSLRWSPVKSGVEFRGISDAPVPAHTEAERTRQMRDLLKRFSARILQVTRLRLRLIPHPIDRYADVASGLVDGGVFLYANGTNPEVLLMLEARNGRAGSSGWSYAAAPLARAKVSLVLGRQVVWTHTVKEVQSPQDTYFLARRPRNPSTRD